MVTAACIFLCCDVSSHTVFQVLELTNYKLSNFMCDSGIIVISIAYYFGKAGLLCFYVIRAGTAFKNSCLEYSDRQIFIYCSIIFVISIISAIGWPVIQLPFTSAAINEEGAYYCIVSAAAEEDYNYFDINTFFLIYSSVAEQLMSIWTVWLFAGRLIQTSASIWMEKKSCDDWEQLDYKNKQHIEIWHDLTKQMNGVLLLTTKLLTLLVVSILTTWLSLPLYMTVAERWFAIDSGLNIFCMYLSLGFAENIWKKCFCGNQCMAFFFPCVKACALTQRNSKEFENKKKSQIELKPTTNDDIIEQMYKNKDSGICEMCNKQRLMYSMTKKEYELYIK